MNLRFVFDEQYSAHTDVYQFINNISLAFEEKVLQTIQEEGRSEIRIVQPFRPDNLH